MATLSEMLVKLGLDAGSFSGGLDTAQSKLDSFGSSALKVGGVLSAAVTVPLTALGTGAISAAMDLEALRNGLIAITGSAEEADRQLTNLKEVAKLPGLGFEEAVRGAINLQAVGFTADGAATILTVFGNALATVGRGREDLNEVIRQLGQLASRGKVTADNLKPLIERVPQLATVMKQLWGTIDTEALQKRGVDSQTFITMVMEELGKLPPVVGGLKNDFENMSDTWRFALGEIGAAMAPLVTSFVTVAVPAIEAVSSAFSSLDPTMQTVVIVIAGLAAAIGPILLLFGGMAMGISAIAGATGILAPALGLIAPILAGIAAAWALWEFGKWLAESSIVQSTLAFLVEGLSSFWDATVSLGAALLPLVEIVGEFALGLLKIVAAIVGTGLVVAVNLLGGGLNALAAVIKNILTPVLEFLVGGLGKLWEWVLKIPGASKIFGDLGGAADGLKKDFEKLTKGTDKQADSSKDLTKKLDDLFKDGIKPNIKGTKDYEKELKDWKKTADKASKAAGDHWAELHKVRTALTEAREQTELFNQGLIRVGNETVDYIREAYKLRDSIASIENAARNVKDMMPPFSQAINDAIGLSTPQVNKLGDAMKTLGLDSIAAKQEIATQMAAARDEVLGSSVSTDFEKKTAIYKALKAQIDAAKEAGIEIPKEQLATLTQLETDLKINLPSKVEGPWKNTMTQVSTAITNAAQSMVGILIGTEEGSIGDAFKKLGQGVLSSFIEPFMGYIDDLIEKGIKKLIGWLLDETGLAGALGSVFGGGGGGGGTGGGGGGGGGGGTGGGGGGGGTSPEPSGGGGMDPLSWINAAANVISAIYGIRQEGTLNAIEENTRFGMIHNLATLFSIQDVLDVLWIIRADIWENVHTRLEEIRDHLNRIELFSIPGIITAIKGGAPSTTEDGQEEPIFKTWMAALLGRVSHIDDFAVERGMRTWESLREMGKMIQDSVVPPLNMMATAGGPVVNVYVTLDGKQLTATVATEIVDTLRSGGQQL